MNGGTHLVTRVIHNGDVNVAGGSSYINGGAGGSGGRFGDNYGGFGGGAQAGANLRADIQFNKCP